MKSVLITGVAGFLGSHCANFFKKLGWRVDGIDPFVTRFSATINSLINDDLSLDLLKKIGKKHDLIVHCAGSGSVAYSKDFPYNDFKTNVDPLLSVLEYMRLYNTGAKLVFPSSAAVYGSKEDRPLKEEEALKPISPYGFHKKIAEELCESYVINFKIKVSIIRFFSLYGIGLEKQLIWDACNRMSSINGDIVFSGTGDETRDWIHIDDAVSLILAIFNQGKDFEIVNGGSGAKSSVRNVLTIIARELVSNRPIIFNGTTREGDPNHYQADISKARAMNWSPGKELSQGIKEYIHWFKETVSR